MLLNAEQKKEFSVEVAQGSAQGRVASLRTPPMPRCGAFERVEVEEWNCNLLACGGQGTARPTTPDSETEVGGGVPSAPQNKKVNLVACIEGFLAAEHAAGCIAAIGYWSADGKWVSKTAAQFIADLKAAYAQRAALRRGR